MAKQQESFSHFASILAVDNLTHSLDFYKNKLGFKLNLTWNGPVDYAVLKRGGVSIHLTKRQGAKKPPNEHTSLYIFVHDLEGVYQEFKTKAVPISNPLALRDYGMRDFDIVDLDGYRLTFGKNAE